MAQGDVVAWAGADRIKLETMASQAHLDGMVPRRNFLPAFANRVARVGLVLAGLLNPGTIMAKECSLSAPLTLKVTQSGVAGETGTVWTIVPDCSFTIARQIGAKVLEPHKRGYLTIDQQARLKGILDRSAQLDFAKRLGGIPQVNPRRISFSYAGKDVALTLPPGGGDIGGLLASSGDDREKTILELATAIKAMLGN